MFCQIYLQETPGVHDMLDQIGSIVPERISSVTDHLWLILQLEVINFSYLGRYKTGKTAVIQ